MCYTERITRFRHSPSEKERKREQRGGARDMEKEGAGVDRQLFRIQYVRMAATSD